jgi:hypothetical protein
MNRRDGQGKHSGEDNDRRAKRGHIFPWNLVGGNPSGSPSRDKAKTDHASASGQKTVKGRRNIHSDMPE